MHDFGVDLQVLTRWNDYWSRYHVASRSKRVYCHTAPVSVLTDAGSLFGRCDNASLSVTSSFWPPNTQSFGGCFVQPKRTGCE